MNFKLILDVLKNIGADSLNRRNDEQYWTVDLIDQDGDKRKGKVLSVSLELQGLHLTVEDGADQFLIAAVPASLNRSRVLMNGQLDPEAAMVFSLKGNISNPSRFGFDFRPVTYKGEEYRMNFRYDP